MSVENSNPSNRSSKPDLSDLQAEYAKKKKRYAADQEQELNDLKEYYNTRKEEVRDQGEAAINHIRAKTGESVNQAQEARKRISDRSEAQINGIETDYRKKLVETQAQRQAALDKAHNSSKEKINEIEQSQQEKIEKLRGQSNEEIAQVKDKYNHELSTTKDFTEHRLEAIKQDNDKSVKNELARGRQTQGKLQENLAKDYEKTNAHGQQRIAERHEIQEHQLARQDQDYQKRSEKQKAQWENREHFTDEQYQKHIQQNSAAYEKQLKEQNSRFQSLYSKTDAANRESLKLQDQNMFKEQLELKKKFFRETQKYAGKEDDPFYKLQDRGNRIRENGDFYVVDAYVPKHEKDNIRVVIQDDKASIAGKRAFKEEIDDEGRKLSTNNYQTFREEFAFDKPVITEGLTRERNGDYITFWIPKLTSFETPRKLNKKV